MTRRHVRSAWIWILGLALGGSMAVQAAPPPLTPHHLQISVADVDALAQWYVAKLGFKIVKHFNAGTAKVVWIDIPGFRLGLVQVVGSSRPASNSLLPPRDTTVQGFRQMHFSVPSVDEAYAALAADGVRFVAEPTTYSAAGIRIATLADPEGNLISLYQDLNPDNALMPTRR